MGERRPRYLPAKLGREVMEVEAVVGKMGAEVGTCERGNLSQALVSIWG